MFFSLTVLNIDLKRELKEINKVSCYIVAILFLFCRCLDCLFCNWVKSCVFNLFSFTKTPRVTLNIFSSQSSLLH